MLDPQQIQNDFPILERQIRGQRLVYLDNAATTQKPRSVIETEAKFYEQTNANIHRGIHTLSEESTSLYEGVRKKVAQFIGAPHVSSVLFTRGTTEGVNLVASSWGRKNLKAGDEILLSAAEHHSNLIPWQMTAQVTGAKLRFIPLTADGLLDASKIDGLLSAKTKLVAITAMSNALGSIFPVQDVIRKAHAVGAKVLVDGAQSVPHGETNVIAMDCDFLAFSAHKMLGPTGVGVLYGRPELLEAMDPYQGGGDMILEVWPDRANWNDLPWKFEAGTPNVAGVVAFGAAIDYLTKIGMNTIREHEIDLTRYALDSLRATPEIHIFGPADPLKRGGVISFNYGTIHPHDIGTLLDQEGVAVRAGHHCCQPLMRDLGISGTARASFYLYNSRTDVDALVAALKKAAALFSRA